MVAEPVEDAEVDVCASCGGMWVDWFDGEVRHVATAILAGEAVHAHEQASPGLRNEPLATGACPRCSRQLASERYVVRADVGPAAGDQTMVATTTGAELLRCEECAGVFVSRTSAALLATLPLGEAPDSSDTGAALLEPLPWQRLVMLVKRLVGIAR